MNKKVTFSCEFDIKKLEAIHTFAAQKGINLEAELAAFLEKKYERLVPRNVRQYIAGSNSAESKLASKKAANSAPKITENEPISDPTVAEDISENAPISPPYSANSSRGYWE